MSKKQADGQGVVFRKDLGQYTVHSNGREIACALSARLHKNLSHPRVVQQVREHEHLDPPAIGDQVRFLEAGHGSGRITEILPRRNQLSRQDSLPGHASLEQVIVANIDQVLPVFAAASPSPKWALLDRYLVSAEAAGLPALICITKTDLAGQNPALEESLEEYRRIGYRFQLVSTVSGAGVEELKQQLSGRISVLVGKSGVGKTSLLNALQPGLGQRVRQVSQGKQGKGMHTTTRLEMFALDQGGALIDTPGMREFGLWAVNGQDLALHFPEMRPLVGSCKFGLGCRHDQEPGCSIRRAVMNGKISPYRYQSYLKLRGTP